jgi:hypothetical protein
MAGDRTTALIPDNVDSDGTLLLLACPRAAITSWPPKISDITASTTKDITYSLTTDGWNHGKTQETNTDERLTLREVLGTPGRVTHTVSLKFFYGKTSTDVVDPLFIENSDLVIFARYATPYEQVSATTDAWDIFQVRAGTKVRDMPTANGKWTKTQQLFPRAKVLEDVKLAA